jgi:hypothetical protein
VPSELYNKELASCNKLLITLILNKPDLELINRQPEDFSILPAENLVKTEYLPPYESQHSYTASVSPHRSWTTGDFAGFYSSCGFRTK